jgi:hypothetical protein
MRIFSSMVVAGLLLGAPLGAADFTVHEWGTFTSVVGSDGRPLSGLQYDEEPLPGFVKNLGLAPFYKGMARQVAGVTVKMETPVLYFYSPTAREVDVTVKFHGGSISQWYPDRTDGEPLQGIEAFSLPPFDYAKDHEGFANWRVQVLAPGTHEARTNPSQAESPHWKAARVPQANRLKGSKGEVEDFIFYRGVGNFALPLHVTSGAGGRIRIENTGKAPIPFLFVYEQPEPGQGAVARVWWRGALGAGKTVSASRDQAEATPAEAVRKTAFLRELVRAGLTEDEGNALLATWHTSYFARPGVRVFWIVPRTLTDAILPIALSPTPDRLERVLVGRMEVLTPEFEQVLARDFRPDSSRWAMDRYAAAYQERVKQLAPTPASDRVQ